MANSTFSIDAESINIGVGGAMENLVSENLRIEVSQDPASKRYMLTWKGKSDQREPGQVLAPYLEGVVSEAASKGMAVISDFRDLEYMNSSTVTPIIQWLKKLNDKGVGVEVIYNKSLKWQDLNFSLLTAFNWVKLTATN